MKSNGPAFGVEIGARVSAMRAGKGWSLRDLERASGIGRGAICNIEQGRIENPTMGTVIALCRGFGVSISQLLEGLV